MEKTSCISANKTDDHPLPQALEPVQEDLRKLKALTPESLPPYNPHVRIKSHAQILKHRLLPIGQCIIAHLDSIPEKARGTRELQLCQYIAAQYWPLPVDESTHLRIMEMYRNALFKNEWREKKHTIPMMSQPSWSSPTGFRLVLRPRLPLCSRV